MCPNEYGFPPLGRNWEIAKPSKQDGRDEEKMYE
jgi:hypothetical protein